MNLDDQNMPEAAVIGEFAQQAAEPHTLDPNDLYGVTLPGGSAHQILDLERFRRSVGRQLFLRSNRALYCIEPVQTAGAAKTQ